MAVPASHGQADRHPAGRETWTFAFYLAGENSLESEQVRNLKEICRGAESLRGVRLVVFFDRDDDVSADNRATTWRGTRVMPVRGTYRDTVRHPLSVDVPESVDARRFERHVLGEIRAPGAGCSPKAYDSAVAVTA
jgi:hypothetical protein